MAWKVYFDDETTYGSGGGNQIANIPNKGIVAVAITGGQGVVKDTDWYIYSADLGFRGATLHGLLRQLVNSPGSMTLVRQGALVSDAAYASIVSAATIFAAG
jgi:hypothetical protein